ncbi:unnamed protein product [Polarella glacialis]|uniref:Uncharacterized protein n=1 Tax=Polarella glacialis TaxID=89957 RepID=A0A813H3X7_POLGL|nr:unnamed protein product [Polarella glacialis]CAE8735565.1 unnamed protein product [Polarella glacialis]
MEAVAAALVSGADSIAKTDLLREALLAADPRNGARFQHLVEDTLQMPVLAKFLALCKEVDAIVFILEPPTDSSQDQDVRKGLQEASMVSNVPILKNNNMKQLCDHVVSATMNSARIRREALGIKSDPFGMARAVVVIVVVVGVVVLVLLVLLVVGEQ